MSIKPISPSQAEDAIKLPDGVIEAFNELLTKRLNNHGRDLTIITQDDAMDAVLVRFPEETRNSVFEKRWLDVEDAYRKAGWKVTFHKPQYFDTWSSHWIFKPNGLKMYKCPP